MLIHTGYKLLVRASVTRHRNTLYHSLIRIKKLLPRSPCLTNFHRPTNCGIPSDFFTNSNFEHNMQVPIGYKNVKFLYFVKVIKVKILNTLTPLDAIYITLLYCLPPCELFRASSWFL